MPVVPDEYVCGLIERAKKRRGIPSDNQLAARMGLTRATVSSWQTGRTAPEGRNLTGLCDLAAEDPAIALAMIQRGRARSPEERSIWDTITERLGVPAAAKIAVLFAMVFVAGALVPQPAPAQPLSFDNDSLLYTSYKLQVVTPTPQARQIPVQSEAALPTGSLYLPLENSCPLAPPV